jgi:hypothetical protein
MQESNVDWTGPYNEAGKNWSALIPEITYMMTRTLTDDPRWGGFEIQIKIDGQLIDRTRITNPYTLAKTLSNWVVKDTSQDSIQGESGIIRIKINPSI